MKKSLMIVLSFFSFATISSMHKKNLELDYYGTIICIKQETRSALPFLALTKNNYYNHLQEGIKIYGKRTGIITYGLSAAPSIDQACSLNHILYFVYNNPGAYSRIEFAVKTKEEVEQSREALQGAIRLADMQIKSILLDFKFLKQTA